MKSTGRSIVLLLRFILKFPGFSLRKAPLGLGTRLLTNVICIGKRDEESEIKASKMSEETVDISVIEYFRTGEALDKKKRRKILDLFKYLAGGESPIEAVELTVRRDWNLREAQLKAVYEMVKLVENPPSLVSSMNIKHSAFLSRKKRVMTAFFVCDIGLWISWLRDM